MKPVSFKKREWERIHLKTRTSFKPALHYSMSGSKTSDLEKSGNDARNFDRLIGTNLFTLSASEADFFINHFHFLLINAEALNWTNIHTLPTCDAVLKYLDVWFHFRLGSSFLSTRAKQRKALLREIPCKRPDGSIPS